MGQTQFWGNFFPKILKFGGAFFKAVIKKGGSFIREAQLGNILTKGGNYRAYKERRFFQKIGGGPKKGVFGV